MRTLSWDVPFIFKVMTFQRWQACVLLGGVGDGGRGVRVRSPFLWRHRSVFSSGKCLPVTVPGLCLFCPSWECREVRPAQKLLPWTPECLCGAALFPPLPRASSLASAMAVLPSTGVSDNLATRWLSHVCRPEMTPNPQSSCHALWMWSSCSLGLHSSQSLGTSVPGAWVHPWWLILSGIVISKASLLCPLSLQHTGWSGAR